MHGDRFKKFTLLFLALASILACAPLTAGTPQPAATLNALYTSAAQTLEAMSTQAANTLMAQPSPTGTLSIPTATTVSLLNTVTPVILPSAAPKCDSAEFVEDITYPDGSVVGRSSPFTKVWRIKNTGTCTWTTSYALVYVSGDKLGAPGYVPMPANVAPGESISVSVNLTAPNTTGRYKGNWKLRNASGVIFGVGETGESNFYVDVNVSGYVITGYDFAANYCDASWENNARNLPCPGTDHDTRGFVLFFNAPKMEDGKSIDKGLVTHPRQTGDGIITGTYPAITVKPGDHFQALIGCLDKANDCDVVFRLGYQIGNGDIKTLGQWHEVFEGKYYPVNIDLSSLAGKKVKFILTVLANGSGHEDYALWTAPRITSLSSKSPTATSTTTPSPTVTATVTPTFTATPTETPTPTPTSTPTAP